MFMFRATNLSSMASMSRPTANTLSSTNPYPSMPALNQYYNNFPDFLSTSNNPFNYSSKLYSNQLNALISKLLIDLRYRYELCFRSNVQTVLWQQRRFGTNLWFIRLLSIYSINCFHWLDTQLFEHILHFKQERAWYRSRHHINRLNRLNFSKLC